jgi:hypothetical protein
LTKPYHCRPRHLDFQNQQILPHPRRRRQQTGTGWQQCRCCRRCCLGLKLQYPRYKYLLKNRQNPRRNLPRRRQPNYLRPCLARRHQM